MPRVPRPWFRFYVEAVHDRKLRCRPPAECWVWVTVLAMARSSPEPGYLLIAEGEPATIEVIADEAHASLRVVRSAVAYFERIGMLVKDERGTWFAPKFGERQFESDDVTARTAKHRSNEQRRNVPTTAVETPPYTETDTDKSSLSNGPVEKPATYGDPTVASELVSEIRQARKVKS